MPGNGERVDPDRDEKFYLYKQGAVLWKMGWFVDRALSFRDPDLDFFFDIPADPERIINGATGTGRL